MSESNAPQTQSTEKSSYSVRLHEGLDRVGPPEDSDGAPKTFYVLRMADEKWRETLLDLFASLVLSNHVVGYLPESMFFQAALNRTEDDSEYRAPALTKNDLSPEALRSLESFAFIETLTKKLFEGLSELRARGKYMPARKEDDGVITLVFEPYHVDAAYRDSYYSYYSRKHFSVGRFSARITFFPAYLDEKLWHQRYEEIKDCLLASCVINPVLHGSVGTAYIDPRVYLNDSQSAVRTSTFRVNVFGRPFDIMAFPYRTQDGESMRCAEVTLLNLISYYSNEYSDYASILGSGIRSLEEQYSYERNLPSRGITYLTLSRILSNIGFFPRLYNVSSIDGGPLHVTPKECMRRILHRYVESGIPVAANPAPGPTREGHSLICVGYKRPKEWGDGVSSAHNNEIVIKYGSEVSKPESDSINLRERQSYPALSNRSIFLTDAADYGSDYVVIDDNQMPYEVRDFNRLSMYPEMHTECLVAPLNQSMMLDALDAGEKIEAVLSDYRNGIVNWVGSYFSDCRNGVTRDPRERMPWALCDERPIDVNVVKRLFLVSSKSFRRFRVKNIKDSYVRELYASIPMPRFLWICELYEEESFLSENPRAFAELILDATSVSTGGQVDGVIICNYPYWIGFRTPDYPFYDYERVYQKKAEAIVPFTANLSRATIER